ncbi:MAG: hypothetical protein HY961_19795 [Ignavibacteriae bacterium]|nr:hypothetical protein [Ignavibacteriota bacterium]
MNLRIGLIAHSASWEQILLQEGVPYFNDDPATLVATCSAIVVNRTLDVNERNLLEEYLQSGGAVLGSAAHLDGVCGTQSSSEWNEYLVADHDEIFAGVTLVDIGAEIRIPREANHLRTQHNSHAVFAGPLGGGYAVILPFDLAALMTDTRAAHKSFYAGRDRLPTERVSLVNKAELHHLLHDALKYLHGARSFPYAHLWYFPDGRKNVFAFRIDTDKGSRQEIDALYHAAIEFDVKMSWFLDVKSHEEWLQHFAFLAGQEIGIHCYEHQVFDSYDENLKNITKAKLKLERAGIASSGFTAPFGMWSVELGRAIDKVGFEYSSEFSYAYDALPLFPMNKDVFFYALQLPIHPICIGSLKQAGYSEVQMNDYFTRVIDAKLARDEPLFFYHHPTHHCFDVMKDIFRRIEELGIGNVTMLEFARWWRRRLKGTYSVEISTESLRIDLGKMDDSVWLRVIHPDAREAIVRSSGIVNLNEIAWTSQEQYEVPDDIRRIREFDPRQMFGNIFRTVTKKITERKYK